MLCGKIEKVLMAPKIIGISGVTGSGKTTLAKKLGQTLPATTLFWDDFDEISISPEDYVEWYKHSRNYDEWDYSSLANILESLKSNQAIMHPTLKYILYPSKYIIFDAPLGRLHPQTGQYIDICFHISVPLDVSLSRRLIRDYKEENTTKSELIAELEYYLHHSRPLFFDDELKSSADYILNGTLTIQRQETRIIKILNKLLES